MCSPHVCYWRDDVVVAVAARMHARQLQSPSPSFISTAIWSSAVCCYTIYYCSRECDGTQQIVYSNRLKNYQFDLWMTCIRTKSKSTLSLVKRNSLARRRSRLHWELIEMSRVLNGSRCHCLLQRCINASKCIYVRFYLALLSWTRYVNQWCWPGSDTKSCAC